MSAPTRLVELLPPGGAETFWAEAWDRETLQLTRGEPHFYGPDLSLAAFDRALATGAVPVSDLVLVGEGESVVPSDVESALRGVAAGRTLTARSVQRGWPALDALCRGLSRDFGCRVNANVYLSPPGAPGFEPHYDTHDVFVLQLSGAKSWSLWPGPERPLPEQPDPGSSGPGAPHRHMKLDSGDLLYLPRGVVHSAQAEESTSLHVSLGVHCWTWHSLLSRLLYHAAVDAPELRRSVRPSALEAREVREQAMVQLADLADLSLVSTLLDELQTNAILERPSAWPERLLTLAALDELSAESRFVCPYEQVQLRAGGDLIYVVYPGHMLELPSECRSALEQVLRGESFSASELPEELCISLRVDLVRRLVREGLVLTSRGST